MTRFGAKNYNDINALKNDGKIKYFSAAFYMLNIQFY